LDEVNGHAAAQFRALGNDPVVMDEDRYEMYRPPRVADVPAWFRAYMWSTLVAGAHPTYGGANTYEAYNGRCTRTSCRGVWGYQDLVDAGVLRGARDFWAISVFFRRAAVTMVGMVPNHAVCGGAASKWMCAVAPSRVIVYAKRGHAASTAVSLPSLGSWSWRCFDPVDGVFQGPVACSVGSVCRAPCMTAGGDAVLLLERE
jgi:hypothetical protein